MDRVIQCNLPLEKSEGNFRFGITWFYKDMSRSLFTLKLVSLSSQKLGFFQQKRQTEQHFLLFGQKKLAKI